MNVCAPLVARIQHTNIGKRLRHKEKRKRPAQQYLHIWSLWVTFWKTVSILFLLLPTILNMTYNIFHCSCCPWFSSAWNESNSTVASSNSNHLSILGGVIKSEPVFMIWRVQQKISIISMYLYKMKKFHAHFSCYFLLTCAYVTRDKNIFHCYVSNTKFFFLFFYAFHSLIKLLHFFQLLFFSRK